MVAGKGKKNNGKKKFIFGIVIFFSIFLICGGLYIYNIKPFSYVKINIKEEIDINKFFKSKSDNASFITDVSKINTNKLGVYDIKIKVNGMVFDSKLEIVDVESPVVEVKDLELSYYGPIEADMFVKSVTDDTNYTISFDKEVVREIGEQELNIIVRDEAGNITKKSVTLNLVKVRENITIEAGEVLDINSLVYSSENISRLEVIQNVDTKKVGEQQLILLVNDEQVKIKVTVVDTIKPVVVSKNVTIWWDQKINSVDKLINSVSDVTNVKKEYVNNIDYSKIGTQNIKIRVTDEGENVTEVVSKVTIKKDTTAPNIKNLSTISVVRGTKPNYISGVKVTDNHDSKVNLKYDSSGVDYNKIGTYTVEYSATDKSGNTKSTTRKVIVTGNLSDVKDKLRPIVQSVTSSSNTESQNALAIRNWVANNISYANSDLRNITTSAWDGITKRKGDCYTHFAITKVMLDLAGIKNMEIHVVTYNHYWNLVFVDGVWRHLDSTPGAKVTTLMTDTEYKKVVTSDWDRKKYPKAE